MEKNRLIAIIVAVLVIASAIGIYEVVTHNNSVAKPTIIFSGWASSGQEYKFDVNMTNLFNAAHPNVTVKFEPITSNYYGTLSTDFSSNSAPGVFYIENYAVPEFGSQGYLQNLTPVLTGNSSYNLSGFAPSILHTFYFKGGLYAAPKDWSPLLVYYNKNIFNAEHVAYPGNTTWNWTNMMKTLSQLKANESLAKSARINNVAPMVVGPQVARALAFMHQSKGQWINQKGDAAVNNTTGFAAGMTFWYNMYAKGLAQLNSNFSAGWNGGDFSAGNIGMVVSGTWTVPVLNVSGSAFYNNMSEVGYYHMPENLTKATMMFNVGLGVNSALNGTQKWIADQFVQFFTGPSGEKTWVSKGLALPSRTAILNSTWYQSNFPIQAYAGDQFPYAYGWNYNTTNFVAAEHEVHNIYANVFAGKISIQTGIQQMLIVTNATLAGTSTG